MWQWCIRLCRTEQGRQAGRKCHRSPEKSGMGGFTRERHPLFFKSGGGVKRKSMFPSSVDTCLKNPAILCFPVDFALQKKLFCCCLCFISPQCGSGSPRVFNRLKFCFPVKSRLIITVISHAALPVSYFLLFWFLTTSVKKKKWAACVSSLQSPTEAALASVEPDWVKWIQKHEGKESSWSDTKGWSCRWELTLSALLWCSFTHSPPPHPLLSTPPHPTPPTHTHTFFPSQVVLLFVMFRGRHQKHLRNGGYSELKETLFDKKSSFAFQQETQRLRRYCTSKMPWKLPMKRLRLSTSNGDKWRHPPPHALFL